MARVAFLMSKLMVKIGLSGKTFIPILLGFGCRVTAFMPQEFWKMRKQED